MSSNDPSTNPQSDEPSATDPQDVVAAFMHAANDHDLPRALGMLHPQFRYREEGSDGFLGRAEMKDLLGWDRVVESEVHCESMDAKGDVVTGIFWETNGLYHRLGIETTRCRLAFHVEDGLVREQTIEQRDEGAFLAALEPFLEWAEEAAPDEIEAIQPAGEFVFSAEMGRRWLQLLDRWRSETGGPDFDDPADPGDETAEHDAEDGD